MTPMPDFEWPSNENTSASGGYLLPSAPQPLPCDLTFEEFLQTVFVGVSGLPGNLVRPKWQPNEPKQPDIFVNWLAIALSEDNADTNAYVGIQTDGSTKLMRMEDLTVQCSFYGPLALEYGKLVRDNFQIKQNLEKLQSVNMNFVSTSRMTRAPDLVNERWVNRWEMSVFLRREIIRTYPVLTFVSGSGQVIFNNSGNGTKTVAIPVNSEEG